LPRAGIGGLQSTRNPTSPIYDTFRIEASKTPKAHSISHIQKADFPQDQVVKKSRKTDSKNLDKFRQDVSKINLLP